jgi:hypothetical protein
MELCRILLEHSLVLQVVIYGMLLLWAWQEVLPTKFCSSAAANDQGVWQVILLTTLHTGSVCMNVVVFIYWLAGSNILAGWLNRLWPAHEV